jgi:hypothetical protein
MPHAVPNSTLDPTSCPESLGRVYVVPRAHYSHCSASNKLGRFLTATAVVELLSKLIEFFGGGRRGASGKEKKRERDSENKVTRLAHRLNECDLPFHISSKLGTQTPSIHDSPIYERERKGKGREGKLRVCGHNVMRQCRQRKKIF